MTANIRSFTRRRKMIERHSIEFDRVIFNVISDDDRRTIALQFEFIAAIERSAIQRVLSAMYWRFGNGVRSRLRRWIARQGNPFVLPASSTSHPDYPDVLCFEIAVKPGERVEAAVATLLDFVRQLPGYKKTYGSPLDPDEGHPPPRKAPSRDVSNVAAEILKQCFKRREKGRKEVQS